MTRSKKPARTLTPARTQGGTDLQAPLRSEVADVAADVAAGAAAFADHNARHENGGADEMNVAGLSGVLADPQTPAAHTHSAADLTSGTVPDARFPATLPAISGANLTNLDAADLASGTIPDARFPAMLPAASGANLTDLDAADLAAGTIPDARFPAALPAISGANLTNLNASAIASGTLDNARLGGASGSFTTTDGKTVTVVNGLITAIV